MAILVGDARGRSGRGSNGEPRWGLGARVTAGIGAAAVWVWAAFWTWFALSVAISEGGRSWLFGGGVAAAALGIAVTVLRWPVVGGALAVAAGVFSLWFFPGAQAALLMGAPAMVGGMLAGIGGLLRRRTSAGS